MNETASREILWNVNSLPNVVGMYLLLAIALVVGCCGVFRHFELWKSGQKSTDKWPSLIKQFWNIIIHAVLQKGVLRERAAAYYHTLIYIGFLVLLFTTTMVFVDHDLGIKIYQGKFYLILTFLSDVLGLGLLIGCGLAAHRRYLGATPQLHNRALDSMLLSVLAILVIQGFVLEGLRIHATNDPWRHFSPVGLVVAKFFWYLPFEATSKLHFLVWWFHTVTVMAVIAVAPYTKFFHIIASSLNLFFKSKLRPKGQLESSGDLAKLMETAEDFSIGLGTIKDYSWKHLLDLDACTSCGRCQAVCPAYNSGKALSPKWLILDTRNHALALNTNEKISISSIFQPLKKFDKWLTESLLLKRSGLIKENTSWRYADPHFRSTNTLVQNAALKLGDKDTDRIAGEVIEPAVFWSCTTCMACVEACPVGINHVDQIVGNRRNMVLMQGEVPSEAQSTLKALENRANPYGDANDRIKWAEGLNLSILKAGDEVDYLYWVGCVSAYDPRKQKIAKALVKLMQHAGLKFGVLGNTEGCSGDPARRLGEENLFQTLAKKNIETLKSIKFKTLVANCPHCFNTIKNEYPEFGNLGHGQEPEIIHHSVLLKRLLANGQIKLQDKEVSETFSFHDPCYLGRYNDEYEAPRQAIKTIKGLKIIEMESSREKALCCGAGGGHFWMDFKIGERVNSIRAKQALDTTASSLATACPFCMQMMEDGLKLNQTENMQVKDIAEVLVEKLF